MFLRPLMETDLPAFAALCAHDPVRWQSVRLHIEGYTLHSPTMQAWGAFAPPHNTLSGVYLRFNNTVVVVDSRGECAPAFAERISQERGVAGVRGTLETVVTLEARLRNYRVVNREESYCMHLNTPPQISGERLECAQAARASDLERIAELYAVAGAMYRNRANLAVKVGKERVFFVEEARLGSQGRVLSCALLNTEGRDSGQIGGVFTRVEARGRGYASACVAALALDLQRAGKQPTLFYENPVAGAAYSRLGFQQVGLWRLLYLQPHRQPIFGRR